MTMEDTIKGIVGQTRNEVNLPLILSPGCRSCRSCRTLSECCRSAVGVLSEFCRYDSMLNTDYLAPFAL